MATWIASAVTMAAVARHQTIPPPTSPTGGNNSNPPAGPKPQNVNVTVSKNSNEARTPWSVPVEANTFQSFTVKLAISGYDNNPAAAGIANIVLEVKDQNNTVVKSAKHRGAAGTTLTLDISPAEAVNLGDWTVAILPQKEGAADLPEGLYRYTLDIKIVY